MISHTKKKLTGSTFQEQMRLLHLFWLDEDALVVERAAIFTKICTFFSQIAHESKPRRNRFYAEKIYFEIYEFGS